MNDPVGASLKDRLSAKERILQAATGLFARQPFSETSLRDIAAAAEVDVAYVHRAFGSKAGVFRQALASYRFVDDRLDPSLSGEEMLHALCLLAFEVSSGRPEDVQAFHLTSRSSVCSEARQIISDFIEETSIGPLARAFGHADHARASIAISMLGGFITQHCLLGTKALTDLPQAEQLRLIETALLQVLRG